MNSLVVNKEPVSHSSALPAIPRTPHDRDWYAVFTRPQHEKSAVRHLVLREIESFLPTYETIRIWKNRQRMKITLPLFPTYLFVNITSSQRTKVLQSPGVLRMVGNSKESIPLPGPEVEFLRSDFCKQRLEPFHELAVGTKVRISNGIMQGIEGTLVRKRDNMRFILTLKLINQHASIQVAAEDLEQILD